MPDPKLIQILQTFSSGELKRFHEFLNSPYHNKNKKAIKLYETIKEYHPGYKHTDLSKENLFAGIFGENKKFNDASIRNLLSDLAILAEKFLAFNNFESDSFSFHEKLLSELSTRKLANIFQKRLNSVENLLVRNELETENEYYKKFVLEELKSSSIQYQDSLKLYKSEHLENAADYITYFYLIKIFKAINFFEFQKQYNIHKDSIAEKIIKGINIEDLLNRIHKKSEKDGKILSVYFRMYLSISNPDNEEFYIKFKKELIKDDLLFGRLERFGLYVILTNCCVQKIDRGMNSYYKECFDVYKLMFDKKLFSGVPGFFSMTTFTSIIAMAVNAGELKFLEKFIREYSGFLNPDHREDAVNYGMAQICFSKKEFNESLKYVSKTNMDFSNFKFQLKMIQLKIFYELSDFESLEYAADAFLHFLSKNKMVGNIYREEFKKFIKLIELMAKFKLSHEKNVYHKINILLRDKAIAGKKWLEEKFKELRS